MNTRTEVIFTIDTLYSSTFGEPVVLAAGVDLSQDALRFGADASDVRLADVYRARAMPLRRHWTQDHGDGVEGTVYWQTVETSEPEAKHDPNFNVDPKNLTASAGHGLWGTCTPWFANGDALVMRDGDRALYVFNVHRVLRWCIRIGDERELDELGRVQGPEHLRAIVRRFKAENDQ